MSTAATTTGAPPISYETYAPRSASQRDRLARIAELTAGAESRFSSTATSADVKSLVIAALTPPGIAALDNDDGVSDDSFDDDDASADDYDSLLFSGQRDNGSTTATAQFDRAVIQQAKVVAARTTHCLTETIQASSLLQESLTQVLDLATELQERHADLLRHSGELAQQCERLQQEEAMLSAHAADIGQPLQHYDTVDTLALKLGVLFKERNGQVVVVRGLPRVNVDSDDFVGMLDSVYEAMAYFALGQGAQGAQGASYATKATALHDAALQLVKEAVADRILSVSSDIQSALNLAKTTIPAEKLEASLVYTRFHGISSRSNSLLTLLQQRITRPIGHYRELLEQCQTVYCSSRDTLLKHSVKRHVEKLKDDHGLVGMTRLASVFLMRLCSVETGLYLDFFGIPPSTTAEDDNDNDTDDQEDRNASAKRGTTRRTGRASPPTLLGAEKHVSKNHPSSVLDDEPFQKMLGGMCSNLHRVVRRGVVLLSDLDLLCQVVSVLREERSTANASANTRAVARSISAMIEDAQERLIFCTLAVLTKEVVKFKPSLADLDYPNKLLSKKDGSGGEESTRVSTGGEDAVQAQMQVYESWFPPMRSVLRVLSKIFRVVEPRVFEDIAFQAVQSCTKSLKEAAGYLRVKEGEIDADLFLVKHLLILREQLSPFDIQLRAVERQLDFSDAGKAVTRFLANRNRRIFSMSTENALVTLLREGVSVHEASVDSKRDLEDALRSACNDFIEHSSAKMAGSLLGFVDACKSTASLQNADLNVQPFMKADAVSLVMDDTKESLQSQVSPIKGQMGVYLENVATQGILLKPVTRKLSRALEEAKRFISDVEESEANGWDETTKAQLLVSAQEVEAFFKELLVSKSSR